MVLKHELVLTIILSNAETSSHRDTGPIGLLWVCAEDKEDSQWH